MLEIRQARKTFDTSQTTKDFGPIIIDFKQVQTSIGNKYDFWHKEFLNTFGGKLGYAMSEFYVCIALSPSLIETCILTKQLVV